MSGYPLAFKGLAYHEASDVLQEQEGDASLRAHLHKVSSFVGAFREEDSIIGNDPYWMTVQVSKATDQGGAITLFELVEATAIKQSGKDRPHREGSFVVHLDESIELVLVIEGLFRHDLVVRVLFQVALSAQIGHDGTSHLESMLLS
eukprot:CAMPEP_0170555606 /NCGR_PEP_ID=MMETSP0211-20121228/13493_1 /TAXON_ID=311385 /ORGANISM="Pseudokeronopsis sp., Strain OXSARD2" /LENGTH=146 /DNA_ID=CAMNT_0010865549 /DNA_START=382 /DNA_END=822 /DNA_ORIENTATION=+